MGKSIERMRANPKGDWQIQDVQRACREAGALCLQPSRGSHYKIVDPAGRRPYTLPARRPIKIVYIREIVKFLDEMETK